jgi:hypothetical protein
MTTSAPPRPPSERATPDSKPLDRDEIEALVEALIEEARQRARRRRRLHGALVVSMAVVAVAGFTIFERTAESYGDSAALPARPSLSGTTSPKLAFASLVGPGPASAGLYVVNADGSGKVKVAPTRGSSLLPGRPMG